MRVTISKEDLELINTALDLLEKNSEPLGSTTYPERLLAIRQRFKQIRGKLKDRHQRSVETLGLSGHGDVTSISGSTNKEDA